MSAQKSLIFLLIPILKFSCFFSLVKLLIKIVQQFLILIRLISLVFHVNFKHQLFYLLAFQIKFECWQLIIFVFFESIPVSFIVVIVASHHPHHLLIAVGKSVLLITVLSKDVSFYVFRIVHIFLQSCSDLFFHLFILLITKNQYLFNISIFFVNFQSENFTFSKSG